MAEIKKVKSNVLKLIVGSYKNVDSLYSFCLDLIFHLPLEDTEL